MSGSHSTDNPAAATPQRCKHILVPGQAHCRNCGDQILYTGLEQRADDLDLEAACHLECAKAVADLVSTAAQHEVLDELAKHTVQVAMDSITRSIEAAEEIHRKVWNLTWSKEVAHG